jgi:hypothetical protein
VHIGSVSEGFLGRKGQRRYLLGSACMLLLCAGFAATAGARATAARSASAKQGSGQLAVQINDDKITLQITKVPQVYLYGVIDADAPQRVAALIKSWKIPNGSDIYLNASGGDLRAGMALGRLFRAGAMSTHLGTPRQPKNAPVQAKTAICTDACAYAYLGGLYRWTPSGYDRIGLKPADPKPDAATQAPDDVAAYVKEMGVKPESLAPPPSASHDETLWLSADHMLETGLANNGNQPLTATFTPSPGAPSLVISQVFRNGEHRIAMQCNPGVVNVTVSDVVGAQRARQIVARGFRSYMEVNQQESASQERDGVSVADQAVVITRLYPSTQLGKLLYGYTLGAWVSESNTAYRYGFAFVLNPVRGTLEDFYQSCWRFAPWPTSQNR